MVTIVTRPFLDRFISEAGFASGETQFASETLAGRRVVAGIVTYIHVVYVSCQR